MKNRTSLLTFSLMLILHSVVVSPASAETQPPNVILIMADDLGYNDLGCYGHPEIKTPVLDQLAKDGIRLTSFYSGATVCTPSRMALLTGSYPSRLGWTQGVVGYLMSTQQGLTPKALTIAEVFKAKSYTTGLIGKWHLGDSEPLRPHRQGFDFTYYINKSNNQTKKVWRGDDLVEEPFENCLLTEKFSNEAIRFIRANKKTPFFLYLPYTAPHFPVQAHPDWKGKSAFGGEGVKEKIRDYGDVVEELDHRIGDILNTLKTEKIDQNTIVIFLSDNGPQGNQIARANPYRGKKWGTLEGGTRVPCIIRWPGVIPAGKDCRQLIAAIDLLPTLSHACGIDLKTIGKNSPVIDGVNVLDTLTGKEGATHQRKDLLYWHGKTGFHAIRVGDWKLFLNREGAEFADDDGSGPVLFHLANDDEELIDLSRQHPEKVHEMQALAQKRIADIKENALPLGGEPGNHPGE
ncbi:MAG: sulfatase-like hydrolase/transferase [Verrucomicrobiae bacterium]|nr:sulfatase-like hydrolase/transferase [Verrucomicrobiae bacterium]NNJ42389.1 sulfatase-like hydrolase/transferase [Akkermansiaceae bacterium]